MSGLSLVCVCAGLAGVSAAERPNFILIFVDDQGYQDLGCFGSPDIRTPHIDRMGAEGMRFTDFYSADSVCTPSRAALMTGCYPKRVGGLGVLFPRNSHGLNPEETTIADMLKQSGYRTACVGKWHLGHLPEFLPTSQGFDSYYGIPYSNDMTIADDMKLSEELLLREGVTRETIWQKKKDWVPLMRNEEVIEYPVDQNTVTRRFTQQAVSFIKQNADAPFFLYLAHTMPHVPLFATPEFEGRSAAGLYGDCIEEIDWSTGEIVRSVREAGIAEKTMILYTSDNGPWHFKANATDKVRGNLNRRTGGSALPLRGYKFQQWEGGMRVPAVMWWPGRIPAGEVCAEVAGTIDVLPTFAALSGASLPTKKIDGKSIVPLIEGRPGASTPHAAYFYRTEAVRCGHWKLKGNELFNLSSDISEAVDMAAQHPEIVARLKRVLDAHTAELAAAARPFGGTKESRESGVKEVKGLKGWTAEGGEWSFGNGLLRQESTAGECGVYAPAAEYADFTLEVSARALSGKEGFRLMVRTQGDRKKNYYRWSLGAFGNKQHSLMAVRNGAVVKRSKPYDGSIEYGRWYHLKVAVCGGHIQCFIDDRLVNEESFDHYAAGSIGLGSNASAVEYRNLKVTAPDGKILLAQ